MLITRIGDGRTALQQGSAVRAVVGSTVDYLGLTTDDLQRAFDVGTEVTGDVSHLAPLAGPRNIICVGLNYRPHAEEAEQKLPSAPLLFSKLWHTMTGPEATVAMPREACELDYEAELAVVIGRPARRVGRAWARAHVGGFMCLNDLSDRRAQLGDGQWFRGKNFPGSTPIGPGIVPVSESAGIDRAGIRCLVNGEVRQQARIDEMVFDIDTLVSYCSHQFDLLAGDVIATGTPAGVGLATQNWLRPGDEVEVGIDGCGVLRTTIMPVVVPDAAVAEATAVVVG